jgi:protein SCO1/2
MRTLLRSVFFIACTASGAFASNSNPGSAAKPDLTAPAPGSYTLQRIAHTPDGMVLDSDGSMRKLANFTTGKVTLFSFIYTYCSDPNGCPLAYATMHTLKKQIEDSAALRNRVRFVSMSFAPQFDTPEMMRSYGGQDGKDNKGLRWHFLTTRSWRELRPLLDGFGQDVSVATAQADGRSVPILQHMLKVYLLDPQGLVREIYSTSFLQSDVLLNDIKTLLLEPKPKTN